MARALSKDAVARGARAVLGRARTGRRGRSAGRASSSPTKIPALGLARMAAAFLRRPARNRRRRHRHQGQILHRRLPARDLDGAGQAGGQPGHGGRGRAQGRDAARPTPRPIRWRFIACWRELKQDGVDHLAIEASSHGLDQYRLDGVTIVGARLHQHHPRSSGLSPHLRGLPRGQAAAVHRSGGGRTAWRWSIADAEHADAFIAAAKTRGLKLITVGETGETIKLLARESSGDAQALTHRLWRQDLSRAAAAGRRIPGLQCAGRGRSGHRAWAKMPTKCSPRWHISKARRAGWRKWPSRVSGAPIYVDYAHTPDALEKVLKALRPHTDGQACMWCSAAAATATRASGP